MQPNYMFPHSNDLINYAISFPELAAGIIQPKLYFIIIIIIRAALYT